MDVAAFTARESIRDVMARYHLAGDRGRIAELVDCFAADGVLAIDGEAPLSGRDAIGARLSRVAQERVPGAERPLLRHHLTTSRIELASPCDATAHSYFQVITEIGLDHAGRYVDRFVCDDGGVWRIAQRRVVVEWTARDSRFPPSPAKSIG